MSQQKPLVTIFTLVYNNAEYVKQGLQCIKDQLYQPVEHIIIDDCSTDNSVLVIEGWIKENNYDCNYIKHQKNKGICASINEIILKAKGKYIYGVSDDLMMPDKLVKDVNYLEANPDLAFCSTNMIIRNVKENTDQKKEYKHASFKDVLYGRPIPTATTIYKRQVLIDVGLFDETLLFEDLDMFLRILNKYPSGFRNDYSVIYCVHEKSIQLQNEIKFQQEFFKIFKKWNHLPDYWLFRNKRNLYAFWYFSQKNKKEALKHLLPAATFFWKPLFIWSLFKLVFYKKNNS